MSTRSVQCPGCQVKINVKNEITRFRCPKCQTTIVDEPQLVSAELLESIPPPMPSRSVGASGSMERGSQGSVGSSNGGFPMLDVDGPKVDPASCIEPKTGLALLGGYFVIAIGILALAAMTFGVGLLLLPIAPLINWFNQRKAMAIIHGSGLKVGPNQFPEIHACAATLWKRVSSAPMPDIYIIEAAMMNAFAVKIGKKNVVLLTDDMIHGCLKSNDPRTLAFVIAHELGHVALNHNSMIRASLKQFKKLSRLDEYSADRVAMRLVNDPQVAVEGMVLLAVGPHLIPYLNYQSIETQAKQVAGDKQSVKAERQLTHPLLFNRLERAIKERSAMA